MTYEEITNLVPVYNTQEKFLIPCLESCVMTGSPLVIVDDFSEEWCVKLIEKFVVQHQDKDIRFIRTPKNLYLPGALYYGAKIIETKYIRRIDSDDKVKKIILPDEEFDALFDKCGSADLITYLRAPTFFAGVIMKTEIFKRVYEVYEKFVPYQESMFEDTFFLLVYFLKENGKSLTNCCTIDRSYFHIFREDSMSKHKKYMNQNLMRHKTLDLISKFFDIDVTDYRYYVNTPLKDLNGNI